MEDAKRNHLEKDMKKNTPVEVITWCLIFIWSLVIALLIFLSLGSSSANAQSWNWSPPAPHHASACRVQSGNRSGSGIYVQHGELRGVLTAAHISEGQQITVTWSDGTKAAGKSTIDKFGHDVAFIFAAHPALLPISMAGQNPRQGDRVEFVVSGGPEQRLRMFWATVREVDVNQTKYNCDVLAGDSGGAILNTRGQLVGIQAFGNEKIVGQTAWQAYRGSGSVSCGRIRDFLGRVVKSKGCEPKGCPVSPNPRQQFYPPSPKLVPVQKPDRRPAARIAPPEWRELPKPSTPPGPSVDYKKLVEMILLKIDPEDFRGLAGLPGLPGKPGPPGKNGSDGLPCPPAAEVDLDDLARQIKKKISGSIRVKIRAVE